jgi:hypothetical protein
MENWLPLHLPLTAAIWILHYVETQLPNYTKAVQRQKTRSYNQWITRTVNKGPDSFGGRIRRNIDRHIPQQFPFLITKREADYRRHQMSNQFETPRSANDNESIKKKFLKWRNSNEDESHQKKNPIPCA